MNSTWKHRCKSSPPRGGSVTWKKSSYKTARQNRIAPLLEFSVEKLHNTRVRGKGFNLSVVTVAVMLGVVFHSGPGVPAVLALSWPVGLRVPSPHRVSTSNS